MDNRRFLLIQQTDAKLAAEFGPRSVFVVSRDIPLREQTGGVVSEVTSRRAAELLVDSTHDLASMEQIERYRNQMAANLAVIRSQEASRREREGQITASDLADQITVAARRAARPKRSSKPKPEAEQQQAD